MTWVNGGLLVADGGGGGLLTELLAAMPGLVTGALVGGRTVPADDTLAAPNEGGGGVVD